MLVYKRFQPTISSSCDTNVNDIRCSSIVWLFVSKALDRSSRANIVPVVLSSSARMSLVTFVRAVSVDWPGK